MLSLSREKEKTDGMAYIYTNKNKAITLLHIHECTISESSAALNVRMIWKIRLHKRKLSVFKQRTKYKFPLASELFTVLSQFMAAACCRSSSSTDTTFLVTSGELWRCAGVACCRTSSLNHLDKILLLPTPPGEWLCGGKFITGLGTTSKDIRLIVSVFR